jgi:acyl-CoA synthetase (AMP-forming)/AMP-acid ligase II
LRFGDLPQVIEEGRELSFSEVERRSAALACGLLARGVGKGGKVGLLAPNSADWVIGWLAINRIGAIAVLITTFGKPRELAHILRHADVQFLLTSDRFLQHDFLNYLEQAVPGLSDTARRRFMSPRPLTCGRSA